LVLVDDRVPAYRHAVERLGVPYLQLGPPTLYAGEYDQATIKNHANQLEFYGEFARIRERHDVVVFSHSRQLWKKNIGALDVGKGNPVLIEGFAKFVKTSRSKCALLLFDYGPDVGRSRKLAAELGIENRVIWMPLMPRKEIMAGLAIADIGADQFISGTFGGTGQEILAMGKPLLVYIDDEWKSDGGMNVPPCVNVQTANEICAALTGYERNRESYMRIGELGRRWFSQFRGEGLADATILLLKGLIDGKDASELGRCLHGYLLPDQKSHDKGSETSVCE
jgi:glycosyltransferase involved in cell wall biosynthesis